MATIKFFLRTEIQKLAPVYLRYVDRKEIDFMLPTPFKLVPGYWSQKKQAINYDAIQETEQFKKSDARDIEAKFEQLKDFILRKTYSLSGPVDKNWLQGAIDEFYYKDAPSDETMNQYIKRFVEDAESGKRLANAGNTKKRYSYGSIRVLTGFMQSWNTFQGIETPPKKPKPGQKPKKQRGKKYPPQPYKPLNFEDVTIDVYEDFVKYFYGRGCSANYIGKHIKSLKTIMRSARDEGLHKNMEIERKAFKTISEPVEPIYLTQEELNRIYELDLSDNKHLSDVRDVFLVGCYTAQRFSDYSVIKKSNIIEKDGMKYIKLVQQKTGEICQIPVSPECETILKRYDYTLPKTFEQKVNEMIKLIGERAKITDLIHVEENRGGMKVKKDVRKCELIKTHCARRTGCSLMYLAGIPTIDIMKVSGHRTETEFLKYIRISKEETAIKLALHPYFRNGLLKVVQ